MSKYIHIYKEWPRLTWDNDKIVVPLSAVRHQQGRLFGKLENLAFPLRAEASLETLTNDVVKSSEIEGEHLPSDQVRSSIARKLGIEIVGAVPVNRNVEGIVEMMIDATQNFDKALTETRLFKWHTSLFSADRNDRITVGNWRDDSTGPMQVVSGALGKEYVHFEAPEATRLDVEMRDFLRWFNNPPLIDPVLKAAIAHLWFVTIHPFDDGNGRIARTIADLQLARCDSSPQRFYSMSAQIQKERKAYYDILEKTQRGNLDVTDWLLWFLDCLGRSILLSEENLSGIIAKSRFWEKHQAVSLNDRQRKLLLKFMDSFEGKLTSSKWAKMAKCSSDTALRDIQELVSMGMLEKEDGGGRSTSYTIRFVS